MADPFAGRGNLTADDYNYFLTQKRRVKQTRDFGIRQNQWQRDTATNEWRRQERSLKDQFSQMRQKMPSAYAGRGLLNSGIYARDLDQFQADRTRELGNLRGGYDDRVDGLGIADRQLDLTYKYAQQDLEMAEKARRSSVAEALRTAQGGY